MLTPEQQKDREFRDNLLAALARLHEDLEALNRSKAANDTSQSDNDPSKPNIKTVIIPEAGLPPAVERYYQAEQNERPAKARWTRITRIIEIGGIIGIFLTVWVYSQQWDTMTEAIRQTQISLRGLRRSLLLSEQQTKAAEIAANAAKSAADTARVALNANAVQSLNALRPYVYPSAMSLIFAEDKVTVTGQLEIVNSGQTPAIEVTTCIDYYVLVKGDLFPDKYPCPNPEKSKFLDTANQANLA
jgi:hypothetical protein